MDDRREKPASPGMQKGTNVKNQDTSKAAFLARDAERLSPRHSARE